MINLVYCGNQAMFDGLLLSLLSASKHTKEVLNVYLFTGDFTDINKTYLPISELERSFLEKKIQQQNPENRITLLSLERTIRDEFPTEKNLLSKYTPYCLMRLFLDMEKDIPSKVLYLDTDTIITRDLAPFFAMDLQDKDIGCVLDNLLHLLFKPGYVNSGVMLMDMDKIRHDGSLALCREKIAEKAMKHPDQDAINKVFRKRKKVLMLSRDYNEQRTLYPSTVIRHFTPALKLFPYPHTINVKPWQIEAVHNLYHVHAFDDLYKEYIDDKEEFDMLSLKESQE